MSADDYAKTRKLIEELEVRQIPRWIHSPGDTPRLSGYRHDPLCLGAAQALHALLKERKAMRELLSRAAGEIAGLRNELGCVVGGSIESTDVEHAIKAALTTTADNQEQPKGK